MSNDPRDQPPYHGQQTPSHPTSSLPSPSTVYRHMPSHIPQSSYHPTTSTALPYPYAAGISASERERFAQTPTMGPYGYAEAGDQQAESSRQGAARFAQTYQYGSVQPENITSSYLPRISSQPVFGQAGHTELDSSRSEEEEKKARRKEQNRLAQQDLRRRRFEHVQNLEQTVSELKSQLKRANDRISNLQESYETLRRENEALRDLLNSRQQTLPSASFSAPLEPRPLASSFAKPEPPSFAYHETGFSVNMPTSPPQTAPGQLQGEIRPPLHRVFSHPNDPSSDPPSETATNYPSAINTDPTPSSNLNSQIGDVSAPVPLAYSQRFESPLLGPTSNMNLSSSSIGFILQSSQSSRTSPHSGQTTGIGQRVSPTGQHMTEYSGQSSGQASGQVMFPASGMFQQNPR